LKCFQAKVFVDRLNQQVTNHKAKWVKSGALLTGRIYDDRGNRMTPSHARKGNIKYRYYLSSALLQGTAERAGTVRRVPATDVEAQVLKSVREHLKPPRSIEDRSLITAWVARVEVQAKQLVIQVTDEPNATGNRKKTDTHHVLRVPWQRTPLTRRREILLPRERRRNMLVQCVPKHARHWWPPLPGDVGGLVS
jgi:hypothetical protein